ncbi:FCS-Like Zinc finger 5-like [Vicia villosa]|uniref:FCS-Like Zinc finger 5-like n=1 Tax=Vicia villosa TaxID=3911 RepID=UPI00273CD5A0|nr:FCS-Like Zinc finger 5-like [Vicia villosa]
MMLGKRPRPPMKRTTSMSEITFDLNTITPEDDPNNNNNNNNLFSPHGPGVGPFGPYPYPPTSPGTNGSDQSKLLATVSPRNHRRNSSDMNHTPDFLRSCFLCKRRLVPGRDIYMYKGDSAFCSLECRQQQMNQDEKKDKCGVASKKQVVVAAGSKVTAKSEKTAVATSL